MGCRGRTLSSLASYLSSLACYIEQPECLFWHPTKYYGCASMYHSGAVNGTARSAGTVFPNGKNITVPNRIGNHGFAERLDRCDHPQLGLQPCRRLVSGP